MIGGHVPMFRMKLPRAPMIAALVVLVLGGAFYYHGQSDPGNLPAQRFGKLALAVSIAIAGMLVIIATGRMWYKHLWHDRYKNQRKRNSPNGGR